MTKKKWLSARPTKCDVCSELLGVDFVDGRTMMGPWAIMCPGCHDRVGCGLGVGRGQKYDQTTLEKIGG